MGVIIGASAFLIADYITRATATAEPVEQVAAARRIAAAPRQERQTTADATSVALEPRREIVRSTSSRRYRNCDAARADGAAPIHVGDDGYGGHLDGDGDGIACEPYYGRRR